MMKDNFSSHSDKYAKYRPTYPQTLFDFIYSKVVSTNTAWDCATGNGQTAIELSKKFKKVYATDISEKQLKEAPRADNIVYSIQPAEHTNLSDQSIDLITISQALHWFDFNSFYSEVKRVLRPDGVIAAWTYPLFKINNSIDPIVTTFYSEVLGSYWDDERKYIDESYATIPFPFKEIKAPTFEINVHWTIDEVQGYLNTWSALQKYIRQRGEKPVHDLIDEIRPFWLTDKMPITFPVYLRIGKL